MPTLIHAIFDNTDSADLAAKKLRERGIPILGRDTKHPLHVTASPVGKNLTFSRISDFSPLPILDTGELISMRMPTVENKRYLDAINTSDYLGRSVILTLSVPDDCADNACRMLLNLGGSRISRRNPETEQPGMSAIN